MKAFKEFADHPFGAWVINGMAVIAFIIAFKIIVSKFPNSGVLGAAKAAINTV